MKALSIRQPWAWAIVNGFKPVENRSWNTNFRGRFLVHAGKSFDLEGYEWVLDNGLVTHLPDNLKLPRGGIVGEVELCGVTEKGKGFPGENNPWFFGPYGFWLRDANVLPFQPMNGKLGFFNVEAR